MVIAPVAPGQEGPLRTDLDSLAALPTSPFAGTLPPTHFARFVVIGLDEGDPDDREPHLLFSARFDGPVRAYLTALAATPPARKIFGHCTLPADVTASDAASLAAHLCRRQSRLPAQYTVSALPVGISVAGVNAAMALRAELRRFFTSGRFGPDGTVRMSQDPVAAIHDLRQLASIQRLTEPS